MKVVRVVVDEIPATCDYCSLLVYNGNRYLCPVVDGNEVSQEVCDPVAAAYRRSDCPLVMDGKEQENDC